MSFVLKSRAISCFYCGGRTAHRRDGLTKKFDCARCGATNYLDKNGDITDPPVAVSSEQSQNLRYASVPTRTGAVPLPSASDTIFCSTCIKNQHLLNENLALYLPLESDPAYNRHVESLPEYRAKLEERYPQVCAKCAPKARERIKQSVYVAKTDHLRRMVDKTKAIGIPQDPARFWRSACIMFGGLGWIISIAVEIYWHAVSSLPARNTRSSSDDKLTLEADQVRSWDSLQESLSQIPAFDISSWIPYVLLIGLFSSWWNEALRTKYLRKGGRMTGLRDYYILQVLSMLTRICCWRYFFVTQPYWATTRRMQAAHLFMVIFLATSTVLLLNLVKLDYSSIVSFNLDEQSLLPNIPNQATVPNRTVHDPSPASARRLRHEKGSFPIDSLGQNLQQYRSTTPFSTTTTAGPPTPPTDHDDEEHDELYSNDESYDPDAMDWTPSSKQALSFSPVRPSSTRSKAIVQQGPSPFHGALPNAPVVPAHKARQPAWLQAGAFRKSGGDKLPDQFFGAKPIGKTESANAPATPKRTTKMEMILAPTRFFPGDDTADTGLESMFDEVFSLRDTPKAALSNKTPSAKTSALRVTKQSTLKKNMLGTSTESAEKEVLRGSAGWFSLLWIGIIPILIFGAAVVIVKGMKAEV